MLAAIKYIQNVNTDKHFVCKENANQTSGAGKNPTWFQVIKL